MHTDERQVLDTIDAMRPEIVRFLQELIRRPSENTPPTGQEGPCQAFIADTLREMGLEVDVFRPDEVPGIMGHPGWLPGRQYEGRPDVVGLDPGMGGGKSLLLVAHVDVEEAGARSLWKHDPWAGEVEKGEVFGRGAADDKSGICASVMALAALRRCGVRSLGRVMFGSVVDEERGGGNGTLACLLRGYTAQAGLYVDGVELKANLANLGGGSFAVEVQQEGEHRPIEDTLAYLGTLCGSLKAFGEQRCRLIRSHAAYGDLSPAKKCVTIESVKAGDTLGDFARRGQVVSWGYALPSERSADDMLGALDEHLQASAELSDQPGFLYKLGWIGRFLEGAHLSPQEPIVTCLASVFLDVTGREQEMGSIGMSDQPLMNRYGAHPTVGFGMGRYGGPGAVHLPDEAISIDNELIPACKVLALVIMRWCGYTRRGG